MARDISFSVRAFKKDGSQPADDGYVLSEVELDELLEASNELRIARNRKSFSYELWGLLGGNTSFFIWNNWRDIYHCAYRAYRNTDMLRSRFRLETLLYFDEVGCIQEPVFLIFSRKENDE